MASKINHKIIFDLDGCLAAVSAFGAATPLHFAIIVVDFMVNSRYIHKFTFTRMLRSVRVCTSTRSRNHRIEEAKAAEEMKQYHYFIGMLMASFCVVALIYRT